MKKEPSNSIKFMRKISEELIKIQILDEKIQTEILDKFYTIMRKYGIKEGTITKNKSGRVIANFEWTMCKHLFLDKLESEVKITSLLNDVPKDLQAYKIEK
jgi:hypothetical protein